MNDFSIRPCLETSQALQGRWRKILLCVTNFEKCSIGSEIKSPHLGPHRGSVTDY